MDRSHRRTLYITIDNRTYHFLTTNLVFKIFVLGKITFVLGCKARRYFKRKYIVFNKNLYFKLLEIKNNYVYH